MMKKLALAATFTVASFLSLAPTAQMSAPAKASSPAPTQAAPADRGADGRCDTFCCKNPWFC